MPKVELYINLQLCDLTGSEQIEVDYTSFDISKIGSRGGARSYSFNLPKTNLNKSVLENPEMVNNLSEIPYTRLPCLILVDGIDVQIRFAEIESAKDVYSVRVYGANSDLFAALNDLKLYDLDFSDYDHIWTMANVVASRLNTEGYIYALIDYHEDSPNFACNNDANNFRIDYCPPSFFVNTILQKIFDTAGYTLENEVEEDSENIIMPLHFSDVEAAPFISEKYDGVLNISSQMEVPSLQGGVEYYAFDSVSSYAGNYYDFPYYLPNTNIRALRVEDNMQFKMSLSIDITITDPVNLIAILVRGYYSDGTLWFTTNVPVAQNLSVGSHTITLDITPATIQPIQRESYYTVGFFNSGFAFGSSASYFVESSSTITISEVLYMGSLLYYNQFLNVSAIMPDMTQTEFIKNYMLLFGLIPIVNEATKVVSFTKFNSIIANLSNAYDWSSKIDYSGPHEVKFLLNEYGQNNYFKWAEDGDEHVPVDATGVIQINNKNLELEKDIVGLSFAATNANFRLNTLGVGNRILPQIGIYAEGLLRNSKVPRLLQLTKKSAAEWGLNPVLGMQYDDATSGVGVADNIPVCHFIDINEQFNLGFGNNIIENYYTSIADIISKLKVVKELVRLSASDVSDIDFTRPVWIQKHESYFYISSIKGFSYTENRSTIVELVKLNING